MAYLRRHLWLLIVLPAMLVVYVLVFSRPFWTGFFVALGTGFGMLLVERVGWKTKQPTGQPDR